MEVTSVKEIIESLENRFDPDAAQGVEAIIQYRITGDEPGDWAITIKDGTIKADEGINDSASATLKMTSKTWINIVNGKVNPIFALATGRVKVKGDMGLVRRMSKYFKD